MGFKPGELEQSVAMLLLDQERATSPKPTAAAGTQGAAPTPGAAKASSATSKRSLQRK
jgi:hypothetical protein